MINKPNKQIIKVPKEESQCKETEKNTQNCNSRKNSWEGEWGRKI